MYATEIDRIISAYAGEHGMTREQFASSVGLSLGTVQRIRQGKDMTLETAYRLSNVLGLSLEELYRITR